MYVLLDLCLTTTYFQYMKASTEAQLRHGLTGIPKSV